jgi:surface protein
MPLFHKKNCSSGYYLDNKKCKKCTIENCDKCYLKESIEICSSCNSLFFPIYDNKNIESCEIYDLGDEDKCLESDSNKMQCLSCNLGYELSGGKCIPYYSFKAIYLANENNQNINLINEDYKEDITEMIIDNNKVEVSSKFTFQKKGKHKVYFYFESQLGNMSEMFKNIKNMIYISFTSNFNTEDLTNMSYMFSGCSSLTSINLSNFEFKNVMTMSYLFEGCSSLVSIDFPKSYTENLMMISYMFLDCSSLKSIDLSYFNTKSVTSMSNLFNGCSSLESIDISNFNTESVNSMQSMFSGCSSLTSIDFSSFNPNKLERIDSLFTNCSKLSYIDISTFPDILNYTNDDFGNISNSGQIKINKKSSKKITEIFNSLKMNWKIIEN